jgi:MoaA/NifB/PqqE/SkfB family radical SAM enzyme
VIKPLLNLVRGRPLLAVFEVTLRCNSACGYCDLPLNEGRYELSREQIQTVFTQLYKDGLRFVLLQGGEPLVRKDIGEIIEDLAGIGFGVTLITNGTRFTPELVERLSRLPVNISISLDSLNRARYRQIRGADQLRMVLNGIELLRDFPNPRFITCIVSQPNLDDVGDVVQFAGKQGFVPVVGAYHWDVERYGKVDAELQYQKSEAARVFAEVLDSGLVPRGYFREYLRENIRWLSGGDLEACDAGRYSIAIDCSGNVAACLAKPHVGNLLEQSLAEILTHIDQADIRACSDASTCNMVCSRVTSSLIRHPLRAAITASRLA